MPLTSTKNVIKVLQKKLFASLDKIDPLQMAAVAGMTWVVHNTLSQSKEFMTKAVTVLPAGVQLLQYGALDVLTANWSDIQKQISKFAQAATGQEQVDLGPTDLYLWVLSFVLAYILITHGGQVLGLLQDGLIPFTLMLLGI